MSKKAQTPVEGRLEASLMASCALVICRVAREMRVVVLLLGLQASHCFLLAAQNTNAQVALQGELLASLATLETVQHRWSCINSRGPQRLGRSDCLHPGLQCRLWAAVDPVEPTLRLRDRAAIPTAARPTGLIQGMLSISCHRIVSDVSMPPSCLHGIRQVRLGCVQHPRSKARQGHMMGHGSRAQCLDTLSDAACTGPCHDGFAPAHECMAHGAWGAAACTCMHTPLDTSRLGRLPVPWWLLEARCGSRHERVHL